VRLVVLGEAFDESELGFVGTRDVRGGDPDLLDGPVALIIAVTQPSGAI
jgi:hypothetical protein